MGNKAVVDLTPEQRAAAAERARLLRLFGEKFGLNRIAENLRNVRTAPATPQEAIPKTRKPGGGRSPKFKPEQQKWLQKKYSRDLKANSRLAKHDGAVPHVMNLAKTKFNIVASRNTLLERIIRPVLRPAKNSQK